MTCYDGYFIRPSPPGTEVKALEESLVRVAGKGAIASWAPTGFGVASGHDILERGLYLALFDSQITQLGPATTEAKRYLAANTNLHPDLLDTFVLLGDPATRLNVLKPTAVTASDFIAAPGTRAIVLTWNTALETNMIGFNIYRAPAAGGNPQRLNPELIPAKAAGQMEGAAYRFDDAQCQAGVEYRYWLEVVELGGASERLGPVEATWLNTVLLPLVLR
jgi:hypothetical protein